MTRRLLPLFVVMLLGSACPPHGPAEHPRPTGWSRWDTKARLDGLLKRLGAAPDKALQRAAAHRDLAWLLLMHFGDGKRAEAELLKGLRDAGQARAPWIRAGLAILHDLRLDADQAAAAWRSVLTQLVASEGTALKPPKGLDADALALLAVDRLTEQLPHVTRPVPERALETLRQRLPARARATLGLALVSLARLRGDERGLRQRIRAAGCPDGFTLSPRYGRYGRIELRQPFPPEKTGVLKGSAVRSSSCGVLVRSPAGEPGIRYAQVVVKADRAGPAQVHVGWARPFVLFVNTTRVFGPESRFLPRPALRRIDVTLRQGENRLLFKLPVRATPGRLQALVTRGARKPSPGARAAKPSGLYRPLALALRLHEALHARLPDRGRDAARQLTRLAKRFLWGRYAVAELERRDPLPGRSLGATRTRVLLKAALAEAPWASLLRLRLASLLRRQGKSQQALTLIQKGTWLKPARRLAAVARIRLFRDLGWRTLALREARKLAKANPGWLPAWKLYYVVASALRSTAAVRLAAKRIRSLDATSIAWARTLAAQGEHARAAKEAARLLALRNDNRVLHMLAEQLRLGPPTGAVKAYRRLVERTRWDVEYRIGLANLLIRRGRRAAALALLGKGLVDHPESAEIGRALRALGRPDPVEAYRVDGRDAVKAYRKAHWGDGKAPVYVLDRSVVRVLPSGGRLVLTHQVVHLRSKESVARYGEVKLPGGVRVLTLRTLKADGTIREPQDVGEKASVSLPDLEVGDFIEVEYVSHHAAQPFWSGNGFYGTSFSFRSLGAHFFRSELVVVTPKSMKLETSAWGPIPKSVGRVQGGQRIVRWTAHRVPLLRREPRVPHLAGVLPTVLVGSRVTWAAYLRQRQELGYTTDVASHGVRALARKLCHGKKARERARAVYTWVQKNVEESGSYYVSAARTLAGRSGSRIILLRTLLRQCDAGELQTWLVRPRQLQLGRGQVPVVRMYTQPLLRVRPKGGKAVFLLPQLQQAPYGYLPPTYRLASAVIVERPDLKPALTPDQPEADSRNITLTVLLEPDGSGVVIGHEKLSGLTALQFRAALRRIPAKHLRQWLERAFFGRIFAGAMITRLKFEHAKELDRPLEMIYRLSVPRLAYAESTTTVAGKRQASKLVLRSGFFPTLLGRVFASLAKRRLPLMLGPVGPLRLTLTIQPPAGFRATQVPAAVSLKTDFGRFGLQVKRSGHAVEIRRRLRVPFRIVSPKRYPAFSLFAARVDRAERITVVLQR